MGKDRATPSSADSQRACAAHSVSLGCCWLLPTSAPAERRAGRQFSPHSGREAHPGRDRVVWVTQWQRRADQNVLAPPAMLLPQSLSRAGSSEQTGQDWRPDLCLAMWAAQPCPAALPRPGRGDPAFQIGPPAASRAPVMAFFHHAPLHGRGREPAGGRDFHPLPGELSTDVEGTQKAGPVQRL